MITGNNHFACIQSMCDEAHVLLREPGMAGKEWAGESVTGQRVYTRELPVYTPPTP